jgi:hypothetical protein
MKMAADRTNNNMHRRGLNRNRKANQVSAPHVLPMTSVRDRIWEKISGRTTIRVEKTKIQSRLINRKRIGPWRRTKAKRGNHSPTAL